MLTLMILGTLWLPLVSYLIYYKLKNEVKFYSIVNDKRIFLGNKYDETMKKCDLINVEFEHDLESYNFYQKGCDFEWPMDEERVSQWIEKAYIKHSHNIKPFTRDLQMAAGPQRDFGKCVNLQWMCGNTGELVIITKNDEEIQVNLGTNVEKTNLLVKYNVNLDTSIKVDDWSVC